MSDDQVRQIARTVLYEGYLLYPYRPSALKNRQRFNFGVLYPASFCDPAGNDRSQLQVECPVRIAGQTTLDVSVRFLQLIERPADFPQGDPWHDAVEREARLDAVAPAALQRGAAQLAFDFPGIDSMVQGELLVKVQEMRPAVCKLTAIVRNRATSAPPDRSAALTRSLVSAHVVVTVHDGELVSLLDPPDDVRDVADLCVNTGVWPVLVGETTGACMLASPIVLYDYPQIAPESAGDLFDGTEIDEILALRILTMTDEEKREARGSDERARQILDRTESLPPEHWAKLHGAVRGMRKLGVDVS